jgi:hypothetical protein
MGGRYISLVWQHDPTVYAPPRYRRACKYQAFIPDTIREINFSVPAHIAGVISEAENAIRDLNAVAQPALAPLARLLLRTESIASAARQRRRPAGRPLRHHQRRLAVAAGSGRAGPRPVRDDSPIRRRQRKDRPRVDPHRTAAARPGTSIRPSDQCRPGIPARSLYRGSDALSLG